MYMYLCVLFAEEMQRIMAEEMRREQVRMQYEEGKKNIVSSALTK